MAVCCAFFEVQNVTKMLNFYAPDAFLKMHQNSFSAGTRPPILLEELTTLPAAHSLLGRGIPIPTSLPRRRLERRRQYCQFYFYTLSTGYVSFQVALLTAWAMLAVAA